MRPPACRRGVTSIPAPRPGRRPISSSATRRSSARQCMREALGDGYVEAIRRVYPHVPDSADYVMFWWDKAAELVRTGRARRFGLITTNSLRQTFNRRVLEHHLAGAPLAGARVNVGAPLAGARAGQVQDLPLHLAFAIPDHPVGGQRRGRGGAHRDDGGRGRRGGGGVATSGQRAAGRQRHSRDHLGRTSRAHSARPDHRQRTWQARSPCRPTATSSGPRRQVARFWVHRDTGGSR